MKIYLAGPCDTENRTLMVNVAKNLKKLNDYDIYCPWELKIENAWDYSQEKWAQMVFDKDVRAIGECDAVIMISVGRESTAGTNWEQGYAYALGKPIYVIQTTKNSTSLMTYCGCTYFFNVTEYRSIQHIITDIDSILRGIITNVDKGKCKTILT